MSLINKLQLVEQDTRNNHYARVRAAIVQAYRDWHQKPSTEHCVAALRADRRLYELPSAHRLLAVLEAADGAEIRVAGGYSVYSLAVPAVAAKALVDAGRATRADDNHVTEIKA